MLSYDNPSSVNGQNAQSSTNSPVTRQPLSSPAMAVRSMAPSAPTNASAARAAVPNSHEHNKYHHVWLVTGPAGCGKSTVAKYIAETLGLPYIEGDEASPRATTAVASSRRRFTYTPPTVPPASKHCQDEQRHRSHRLGPVGLAHESPRGVSSSVGRWP